MLDTASNRVYNISRITYKVIQKAKNKGGENYEKL